MLVSIFLFYYLCIYLFIFAFRDIFQFDKGESVYLIWNVLQHKVDALEWFCIVL